MKPHEFIGSDNPRFHFCLYEREGYRCGLIASNDIHMVTAAQNSSDTIATVSNGSGTVSECATCRYSWPTGTDGSHSCATALSLTVNALRTALQACISTHCPNEKVFCGACSPARELLKSLEAK